jgi:hypothetical protein
LHLFKLLLFLLLNMDQVTVGVFTVWSVVNSVCNLCHEF